MPRQQQRSTLFPYTTLFRSKGDAVDACRPVFRESTALYRAGICLQGHLEVGCQCEMPLGGLEERRHCARGKQARRAAAEKDADHLAAGDLRRLCREIALQSLDVATLLELAMQGMRVEIAVRAFAHAPRKMHIKRERRGFEHGSDCLGSGTHSIVAPP